MSPRPKASLPAWELTPAHLAALPHPALLARVTGELEFANAALCKLLGLPLLKLPFEALNDVVLEEDQPDLRTAWLKAASGLEDVALNVKLRTSGEGERYANLSLSVIHLAGASPKVLGIITDIDALKRSRDEVERLKTALDGSGQGVWDHDLERGKVYFSPNWYRMRGFDPEDDVDAMMGGWFDRLHPDDLPMILDRTARQNSGELPENAFEYRERHRDGHWLWVLSRGRPVAWRRDGSVARIVGTDTDITTLKQAEARLADEKDRLRVTLQAVADGIISTDASGLVTYLNPAAETLCGWTAEEAVGRSVEEIYPATCASAAQRRHVVVRCLEEGTVQADAVEFQLSGRDGPQRDVQHTASPLTSGGEVVGSVLVFRDVTDSAELRRRLAHAAMHDPLTGLPNRAAFGIAVEEASRSAAVSGREHALCYIDLDHFKRVNDEAGHAAGDEVLKATGTLIKQSCRGTDFAGRIGGDEFVLVLHDCPISAARRTCEKLIASISAQRFRFDGGDYSVGASIGVASISQNQPSPSELTSRADAACYQSKSLGRGRVSVYGG